MTQPAKLRVPAGVLVHRYYLPQLPKWEDGWSLVYVDQWGVLAIASDWGNFTYVWGKGGTVHDDFREELLRFDAGYLQNKLADHHHPRLNVEKTAKLVREYLLESRRSGSITRAAARADWDYVAKMGCDEDWRYFLDSPGRYERYWEMAAYEPGNINGLRNWIEKSWPRLRAMIQQELAAERRNDGRSQPSQAL